MKFKFTFGINIGSWWSWSFSVGTEPANKIVAFLINDATFTVLTINCPLTLGFQWGWGSSE